MRNCPVALAIDLPKAIIALVGLYDMTDETSLEKIPTPRLMKQSVHTCTMNFAFPTSCATLLKKSLFMLGGVPLP